MPDRYSASPSARWPTLLIALAGCLAGQLHAETPVTESLAPEYLPPDFFTFEPDDFWREPRDSYWIHFSNWVIRQEHSQSQRVQALGAWADRTLSGNPRALPANESYLRLGLAAEAKTGQLVDIEPEARFRLDLPTAEEQLRVIVESESDELIPLEERRRSRQLTEDQRSANNATGALRYLSTISDTINFSNDIGARLRFPPDVFWRASVRGDWRLDDWRVRARQRVYYFHQSGWGASTWFGLGRNIGNDWTFMASSEAVWKHDDRSFELAQILDFHKRLNNRSELNPRFGILGESRPGWRDTSYFADVTWRYRLYQDWLYGEVIPSVKYERDNDFQEHTSVVLRLEMFFSGSILAR